LDAWNLKMRQQLRNLGIKAGVQLEIIVTDEIQFILDVVTSFYSE
jgi:bifunctional DNA-binding transcriptional regulator/antitoxin component of YhaV-PrlF toxin-antitoxin module